MVDIEMKKFSLKQDEKYLIPILKEILAISPNIKIMASPWSAPAWMKSNKKTEKRHSIHSIGGGSR